MISIKDLHAWYGPVEALKGLDIDIRKGKITCLIGNNGAGKTTLIRAYLKTQTSYKKCTKSKNAVE